MAKVGRPKTNNRKVYKYIRLNQVVIDELRKLKPKYKTWDQVMMEYIEWIKENK